jgi:hypothetical protein
MVKLPYMLFLIDGLYFPPNSEKIADAAGREKQIIRRHRPHSPVKYEPYEQPIRSKLIKLLSRLRQRSPLCGATKDKTAIAEAFPERKATKVTSRRWSLNRPRSLESQAGP